MLSETEYQQRLKVILSLTERRSWQPDRIELRRCLTKETPRFVYFPLINSEGKKLFFKGAFSDKPGLLRRFQKELLIQKWLSRESNLARRIFDSGQIKNLFWYVGQYFRDNQGLICREENISSLKPKKMIALGHALRQLWQIKQSDLPIKLKPYLLINKQKSVIINEVESRIREHLETLYPALEVSDLNWLKSDGQTVILFFKKFKESFFKAKQAPGVLIHGDLAPNNVFFGTKRAVLLDWESAYWSCLPLLDWGLDVASFYTRAWENIKLGKKLIKEVKKSKRIQDDLFDRALKIGLVLSSLQKLAPMFKGGFYRSDYDQCHFNSLVGIIRRALNQK
ncbi:MAG: phosphotransferase [Candidatus Pacebacteria bacterium]|nr:phosphotransferase [Candidatus Paceibacterota bacterium]